MKIFLQKHEIHAALVNYIDSQGITTVDKNINVSINSKKGASITAEVDITEQSVQEPNESNDASIFGDS